MFPPESGLYRRGADPTTGTITLYFHFPEVAPKKWQDSIAELEALTGWSVRVHPEAHMGMLSEAARRALPEGWTLLRNPSVNRERRLSPSAASCLPVPARMSSPLPSTASTKKRVGSSNSTGQDRCTTRFNPARFRPAGWRSTRLSPA